jgi:putative glutamine amidotransferase
MKRPRILITLDLGEESRRGVPFPLIQTKAAYAHAVEEAGGVPLLVAPTAELELQTALVDILDGLVITGGSFDISPEAYGESPNGARLDPPKPLRTEFERALLLGALSRRRPVLAVCGGMQLLNVALGGTLHQDIRAALGDTALEHEQPSSPERPSHDVEVVPGTLLYRLAGSARIAVNSTHHQAIDRLGRHLSVFGRSKDGVIEAVGLDGVPYVVGVQWHPELLDDSLSRALYAHLVEGAVTPLSDSRS